MTKDNYLLEIQILKTSLFMFKGQLLLTNPDSADNHKIDVRNIPDKELEFIEYALDELDSKVMECFNRFGHMVERGNTYYELAEILELAHEHKSSKWDPQY